MSYYRLCGYCGAALDPDEKCDCPQKENASFVSEKTDIINSRILKTNMNSISYADIKAG